MCPCVVVAAVVEVGQRDLVVVVVAAGRRGHLQRKKEKRRLGSTLELPLVQMLRIMMLAGMGLRS
jgi:hypothetical protein